MLGKKESHRKWCCLNLSNDFCFLRVYMGHIAVLGRTAQELGALVQFKNEDIGTLSFVTTGNCMVNVGNQINSP